MDKNKETKHHQQQTFPKSLTLYCIGADKHTAETDWTKKWFYVYTCNCQKLLWEVYFNNDVANLKKTTLSLYTQMFYIFIYSN